MITNKYRPGLTERLKMRYSLTNRIINIGLLTIVYKEKEYGIRKTAGDHF